MFRVIAKTVAVLVIAGLGGGVASAKQCHDARGKFTKCPAALTTPARCRDAKGKFTKCLPKK